MTDELPSNWGRWGVDDERGTLNLVTGEVRARAVAEARTGRTVSLSRPVPVSPVVAGPGAAAGAPSLAALQIAMYTGAPPFAMAELLILLPHSPELTHLDSVAHMVLDGQVYPGRALQDSAGPAGVSHGSTAVFADGVATRGVLLDLAPGGALPDGHLVTGADLDAAAELTGTEVQAGDAVVVRGGWNPVTNRDRRPGMTLDAVRWMHRHDVALYAGDIGDPQPPDRALPAPLHTVGLARLGMPLIDAADPDELAQVCAELGRYSFLFVAAPLRLHAASGVPVNPIAVF